LTCGAADNAQTFSDWAPEKPRCFVELSTDRRHS
jgi:hypothetical protein